MTLDPESLDLMAVTAKVRRRAHGGKNLDGYLEGKTNLRDILVAELACSELEAEQVVDLASRWQLDAMRTALRDPSPALVSMFTMRYPVNMAVRHKHLKLEQSKLDRAKRLLGVKTEQETVERALDVLLGEEPILRAHRRLKGVGGFVDVFGRAR